MQKNIQLQVPKLCHENWDKMNATDKGRFCLSCRKEVIDFSMLSDQQILQHISKASEGFCGKFNNEQLNRDIKENRKPRLTWYKYFIHVSLPALLLTNKLSAQQTKTIGDTIICSAPRSTNAIVGKLAVGSNQPEEKFVIEGRIVDEKGNALNGATIMIKGSQKGTISDSSGNFKISVAANTLNTMLVSYIGYEQKEIPINPYSPQHMQIILKNYVDMGLTGFAGAVVVVRRRRRKPVFDQIKDTVVNICYKESIKVYPNPIHFGSTLNIDFDVKEIGEYNILVSNISGQPLIQKKIMLTSKNHSEQMSLTQNFSDGLYFVTVQNISSKKIFTSKILVD